MRANAAQREPLIRNHTFKNVYAKLKTDRAAAPLYIIHDGPPYANGNLHLGHILNKVVIMTLHMG